MESRARVVRRDVTLTIAVIVMIPVLSHEMLITAVEMVCYFCTAIGVACTFLFVTRA
jgi:hypothetical protein